MSNRLFMCAFLCMLRVSDVMFNMPCKERHEVNGSGYFSLRPAYGDKQVWSANPSGCVSFQEVSCIVTGSGSSLSWPVFQHLLLHQYFHPRTNRVPRPFLTPAKSRSRLKSPCGACPGMKERLNSHFREGMCKIAAYVHSPISHNKHSCWLG